MNKTQSCLDAIKKPPPVNNSLIDYSVKRYDKSLTIRNCIKRNQRKFYNKNFIERFVDKQQEEQS
jgi:hypothetical protein